MDQNRKKAIVLSVIYCVFWQASVVGSKILLFQLGGADTTQLPIWYIALSLALICLVNIPLLLSIKRYATLAKMKVLSIIAFCFLLIHFIGVVVMLVFLLFNGIGIINYGA